MAAANRPGPLRDPPIHADGRLRFQTDRPQDVIVGSLIRFENEPRGGTLSTNGPHRGGQDRSIIPPNPEENRARRMRGDDDPIASVVVIVESRWKRAIHFSHGVRLDGPRGPATSRVAVTEHLVGPVARPPGGRGQRTNDSPTVLVFPENTGPPNRAFRFLLRDDAAHRLPVQRSRGGLGEDAESGRSEEHTS